MGMFISTALFVYVTVEQNKTSPPDKKRFPTGRNWREIRRPHEQRFPMSTVRTGRFVLGVLSPCSSLCFAEIARDFRYHSSAAVKSRRSSDTIPSW